jgi:hypothetical protein
VSGSPSEWPSGQPMNPLGVFDLGWQRARRTEAPSSRRMASSPRVRSCSPSGPIRWPSASSRASATPGGRLTGVHGQFADLTANRLELLKEMIPRPRRVVTFYSPDNPATRQSMTIARDRPASSRCSSLERPVASIEDPAGGSARAEGEIEKLMPAGSSVSPSSLMRFDWRCCPERSAWRWP